MSFQATQPKFNQDNSLISGVKPYHSSCTSSGSQICTSIAQVAINSEANDHKMINLSTVSKNGLISSEYWSCSKDAFGTQDNIEVTTTKIGDKEKLPFYLDKSNRVQKVDNKHSWKKRKRRVFRTEESNELLRGLKFRYSYIPNSKYNKKLIVCKYPGCNKTFNKSWNFKDHALMHEGVKPYTCNVCLKNFTQKGNMEKHMKTHKSLSLL